MKRVFQKFNYTLPLNLYKAINVPVFHKNEFIRAGGADILVTTISNMVEELKFQNQRQAFLFDSLGRTIHFSKLNNFRLNQPIAEKVATAVNNIISHLQLMISQTVCSTNELDRAVSHVDDLSKMSNVSNQSILNDMDTVVKSIDELMQSPTKIDIQAHDTEDSVNQANALSD